MANVILFYENSDFSQYVCFRMNIRRIRETCFDDWKTSKIRYIYWLINNGKLFTVIYIEVDLKHFPIFFPSICRTHIFRFWGVRGCECVCVYVLWMNGNLCLHNGDYALSHYVEYQCGACMMPLKDYLKHSRFLFWFSNWIHISMEFLLARDDRCRSNRNRNSRWFLRWINRLQRWKSNSEHLNFRWWINLKDQPENTKI